MSEREKKYDCVISVREICREVIDRVLDGDDLEIIASEENFIDTIVENFNFDDYLWRITYDLVCEFITNRINRIRIERIKENHREIKEEN